VLHGKKVIEVKCSGVSKGRTVLRPLSSQGFKFILAIGDDLTDESMFRVLPKWAYTIRVGLEPSFARFNLPSQSEVLSLLKELAGLAEEARRGVSKFKVLRTSKGP